MNLTFEIQSSKETCAFPGMCLMYVPKMRAIGPMVQEELENKQTDRQTEDLTLSMIQIDEQTYGKTFNTCIHIDKSVYSLQYQGE